MSGTIDSQYLTWLYARIGDVNEQNPTRSYWKLFQYLYDTEFAWVVANDDNRVEDGRYLRYEFLDESGLSNHVDPNWMGHACSIFELLLGLAKHLEFQAERTIHYWFWIMLNNLDLQQFNDTRFNQRVVEDIVSAMIWRTYDPDGRGGIFPLRHPRSDQRHEELWHQLSSFVLELD